MHIPSSRRLIVGALAPALAPALAMFCASGAHAQLVFGTTTSNTANSGAFYLDVNTNQVTTLWNTSTNHKVNGMAADEASGKLYTNDAARLSSWNYGSIGTVQTTIAGMYRTNDNITFTATGVDGLAFAHGNLYGATSFASAIYRRGIYQINTTHDGMATPHCVMTALWTDPLSVMSFGGLEYNAANNLFYFTNTTDNTSTGGTYTQGIYTVDAFGSGTLTKILDFPVGHSRIDGLAIGGGKLWLTEQDPANSRINVFNYDLTTNTFGTTLFVPLTEPAQRASGAAWAPGAIPTPGTLGLLGLGGLAMARRRRN